MEKRQSINPKDVWNPDEAWEKLAPGETSAPGGWSQITKKGNIVFIAGQLGMTKDLKMPGDLRPQLEITYENLDKCLKAVGGTWDDVLHFWIWTTTLDLDFYNQWREVQARYIAGPPFPGISGIGVTRLSWPKQKVEVGALVVLG